MRPVFLTKRGTGKGCGHDRYHLSETPHHAIADPLRVALERIYKEALAREEQTGEALQIAKGGRWCVAPALRPKDWQKMGLKER